VTTKITLPFSQNKNSETQDEELWRRKLEKMKLEG